MMKKFNSRGQAALTDSMFLLTIVTSLAILMFVFVSDYGTNINDQLLRQYSTDFVTDSLKTILYISSPRISTEKISVNIGDQQKESDYLLALVKEDFGDSFLTDNTKKILRDSLKKIMVPVSDQFDYIFYIALQDERTTDYKYFLLYKSEFFCDGKPCEGGEKNAVITYPSTGETHTFYLCNQDQDKKISGSDIENLVFRLGTSYQANNPVILYQLTDELGNEVQRPLTGRAGLILWSSTLITDTMLESLYCKKFD
ncbi:MAG: hypothetical protein Q7K42_04605, partial [Candidatus Diapherotrites archaeon]|nr:hypothetical protein [Candidatus Diapherotrites archaeon]